MALHAWSSARWTVPLPEGHRFPIAKYGRPNDRAVAEGLVSPERLHEPERVPRDDLLLVHEAGYVDALERGIAVNLAGGTHNAFSSHGQGFCVFDDVAVAIRAMRKERRIRRAAIVDLDVHQENWRHAIFAGDASRFTFSMHGDRNYPFRKVPGSLDVELDDGTGDERYLYLLGMHLQRVLADARPDFVAHLAGGYGATLEDTVQVHVNTVRVAARHA